MQVLICQALDRWAELIRLEQPEWTITGGRLEQLLFRRSRDGSDFYTAIAS